MKILIVSGSYYPVKSPRSFRTTELARELARQGHVVWVATSPSELDISEEKKEYHVKVSFLPIPTQKDTGRNSSILPPAISSKVKRLMEWAFEPLELARSKAVYSFLKQIKDTRVDLLISIAFPHANHWGCDKFIRDYPGFCQKWIADCGDPFMGATMNRLSPPFWFAKLEKSWCRHVDYITVPIEGAIEGYYPEFRNKIRIIPQGFRMDNLNLPSYKRNPIPTFAYSGGVGLGQRDPRPIIRELEKLRIEYHGIFYTNQPDFYNEFKNNPRIELRDYIDREELIRQLATMDFLLNLDNGTIRQLPSKLIDYTISGRPILNIDVSSINKTILNQFLNSDYSNQLYVSPKENYDIINIASKFISLANK